MEQQNKELRDAMLSSMMELRRVKPAVSQVCGLPAGEFFFLQRIHELSSEKELRVSGLRDSMEMSMPAVSQFLRTLEDKGMILRQISQKDRRVTLITVTVKGRAILLESQAQFDRMLDRLIQRYGREQMESLTVMIKRLASVMQELRTEFEQLCNERTDCT